MNTKINLSYSTLTASSWLSWFDNLRCTHYLLPITCYQYTVQLKLYQLALSVYLLVLCTGHQCPMDIGKVKKKMLTILKNNPSSLYECVSLLKDRSWFLLSYRYRFRLTSRSCRIQSPGAHQNLLLIVLKFCP